jgi:hypothetical protein
MYNMYSLYPNELFLNFFSYKILKYQIFFKKTFRWPMALAGSVSFKIWAMYTLFFKKNVFFSYPESPFFYIFQLITNSFQSSLYKYLKNVLFFQCGIWSSLVYIPHVHKKKVMFFQFRIKKNLFDLNTST